MIWRYGTVRWVGQIHFTCVVDAILLHTKTLTAFDVWFERKTSNSRNSSSSSSYRAIIPFYEHTHCIQSHTQSLQTIRELHRTKRHPKKPEKRMIIKRKACIIINQIMYLLSECVREWACAYVSERVNECSPMFSIHELNAGSMDFSVSSISLFALHAMNRRIQSETNAECDVKWLRGFCVLWKYIELTKHSVADTQQFWTFQMIFHCILRSKNKWRTLRVKAPLRSLILI